MQVWKQAALAQVLVLAACVPRLVGVGDDDESTSSADTSGEPSSTSESSSTSDTSSTSDDDTSTSTDASTTSTDTEHVFIVEIDYPNESCYPFAQDCPEGDKCVPYSTYGGNWDNNKCVPVMGEQATGEPCHYGGTTDATDDCDATSFCWDVLEVDGELIGTCHAFCTGTPDAPSCPDGSQCRISGDSTIAVCIPNCDPLVQDCNPGTACYWANDAFSCITTSQDLPTGSPCGFINDCAAGHICVDAGALPDCMGAACCTPFCNLELGPGECDVLPGTECVPFWHPDMAEPGYEYVGVCVLPE